MRCAQLVSDLVARSSPTPFVPIAFDEGTRGSRSKLGFRSPAPLSLPRRDYFIARRFNAPPGHQRTSAYVQEIFMVIYFSNMCCEIANRVQRVLPAQCARAASISSLFWHISLSLGSPSLAQNTRSSTPRSFSSAEVPFAVKFALDVFFSMSGAFPNAPTTHSRSARFAPIPVVRT